MSTLKLKVEIQLILKPKSAKQKFPKQTPTKKPTKRPCKRNKTKWTPLLRKLWMKSRRIRLRRPWTRLIKTNQSLQLQQRMRKKNLIER